MMLVVNICSGTDLWVEKMELVANQCVAGSAMGWVLGLSWGHACAVVMALG